MAGASDFGRTIRVPDAWGLTSVTMHFEGEDLSQEDRPFAANLTLTLRMDVDPGTPATSIAARDLGTIRGLPSFELIGQGALAKDAGGFEHIEFRFDKGGEPLQQLFIYIQRGERVYLLTGVHRAPKFSSVKQAFVQMAKELDR